MDADARLSRRVARRFLSQTGLPVPAVDQSTGMCGPASLKAVLAYYGVEQTEDELRKLSGATEEDGVDATGLARAAKALGFRARVQHGARLADIKAWLQKGVPVIVDWFSTEEGHYSVVTAIRDGDIFMIDPELGTEREMPLDKFERVWFDFDESTEEHEGLVNRVLLAVYR